MGLGELGNMGDLGKMVGGTVALAIAAIVLLTFAPQIAGDIDGISVQSKDHCVMNGERFNRVVEAANTVTNGTEAWNTASGHKRVSNNAGICKLTSVADKVYFSPKGSLVWTTSTAGDEDIAGSEWRGASKSLTALAGGSLVGLLFGAMAILLPAGALGFLGYLGAQLVQQNIGGGTLAVAIGATVAVVLVGSLLPEIFEPLDDLYNALDGNRYQVYDEGIGKLGGILGNFLGISLIGGLITLGVMLWKGRDGSSSATSAMV